MLNPFDRKKYPECFRGHEYALDVLSGKIIACKFIKGACDRYLRMLKADNDKWYFDQDIAEKYLKLTQKFENVIGHWASARIIYEPWQCWMWMNVMGFINKETGYRLFRIAHVEVGRGNGKSSLASMCALYFLALDNPNGNQISTVATKKDQARIVLDSARAMARKNESYRKHTGVKVLAHSIIHQKSNSIVRALSSEHKGLDGLNDVLAICDELHAMNRDVFEVISSGMSKRTDSLILCITTAGQNVHSVGYSQSTYAKKVALSEVEDDQFFSAIYSLDDKDDWQDEKVWIKSNPNLGISVDLASLKAKVEKAIVTPADIPNIKIKHLNLWIAEAEAFYDQKVWDTCADPTLKIEDFKNKQCRLGVDLASHIDITSIAIVFRENGVYSIFDKSYLPEETLQQVKNTLYDECIARGYLIKTPGAAINYDFIKSEVEAISKNCKVVECLYDAWNATQFAQTLSTKVEMVKIAMNTANLSEPMKKLDVLMRTGKIRHNGSPLLRWCLGNVVAKADHNGNVFPRKTHEKLKIDPIVATLMALASWVQEDEVSSVYESRGIRSL